MVDNVNTLNPSDTAQVGTSFDDSNVNFTFGIPRDQNGNDLSLLNMTVSDPPTQGEMQAIASKLDALIMALRR